jgi:hypothetical protein
MKKFHMARRRGAIVTEIIIYAVVGTVLLYIAVVALSLVLGK